MKKIVIPTIIFGCFCLLSTNELNVNLNTARKSNMLCISADDEKPKEVVSYVSVMNSYYNIAISNIENSSISFNDFLNSYYNSNSTQNICDYTLEVATTFDIYTTLYEKLYSKGNTWSIRVYNPTSIGLTVYYNSKMCFLGDAQNWTGLSDIKSIYISSKSETTVKINENRFATSITVSYIASNYRLISYADNLDTNGSLNVAYATINR